MVGLMTEVENGLIDPNHRLKTVNPTPKPRMDYRNISPKCYH